MQVKRILVLGNGGREQALSEAYAKSRGVKQVYVLPGNGLVGVANKKVTALTDEKSDYKAVLAVCRKYAVDLVDVAQDSFLADGLADKLQNAGILAFGPTQKASEIEWSKEYSRKFMQKYHLPSPRFASFSDVQKARSYLSGLPEQPLYIKASGLALGKGAIRADNKKEAVVAISEMQKFGPAGQTFLIEECMTGEEFSYFVICDGQDFVTVGAAQDHKTVLNQDRGENTGGMGAVAPCGIVSAKIAREVEQKIIKPFLLGMAKEGRAYSGVLYAGCMLTQTGVKIVEFNARWGDPEAEVLLPAIQSDYLSIVMAVLEKRLGRAKITVDTKTRVSVAGSSSGYPEDYSAVKGKKISGLEKAAALPGVLLFGSGIVKKQRVFLANGGRVFHLVGVGDSLVEARERVYAAMSMVYIEGNNLQFRTDIGWRDMERTL